MIFDILLCAIIILLLQLISPHWWWVIIVPFLYGLIKGRSAGKVFLVGMLSAGVVWLCASLYYWRLGGEVVARRVAEMLSAPSPWLLVAATVAIAVVAGGLGAITGYFLRTALRRG